MAQVLNFPTFQTTVDVAAAAQQLTNPHWRNVDCRFRLGEPAFGRAAHRHATVQGAAFLDLDTDLAAPAVAGLTGRHPLPDFDSFAHTLARAGISQNMQVALFDDMGGPFAARAWWMLRWAGLSRAAVLSGGLSAWQSAGYPVAAGADPVPVQSLEVARADSLIASTQEVLAAIEDEEVVLIDARDPERYSGEHEPIDAIAGHIPGAVSVPWKGNLHEDGRFLSSGMLYGRFSKALAGKDPARAICYCGSGVTACHNVLAMVAAGMAMPRLYVGSWSEWILDPSRPRSMGAS